MSGSDVLLTRTIRGPVTLITLGVLFALNNFTPYRFYQTWPVLLIVFGLLSLLGRGNGGVPRAAGPGRPGFPPYGFPPPASSGSYRQSSYPGTSNTPSEDPSSKPPSGDAQ